MSIKCKIRYNGSDSLNWDVTLHCMPAVGETLYLDEDRCTVESITHKISTKNKTHEITINVKPSHAE